VTGAADIDATIAAEHFNARASALKAAGLPGTSEGWQDELASVAGLTVALRRARDRSGHPSIACTCYWCAPLYASARKALRLSAEAWEAILWAMASKTKRSI
jgi:hypothetical protein